MKFLTQKASIAFTLSSSYIKQETSGKGHCLPNDHKLKNLNSGTIGDATYRCQMSRLYDYLFQTRIFVCFPYISLCNRCDPTNGDIFDPKCII